ncbi:MAG: M48 family metallopeptidase [Oscillospiraceae bacterium]
MDYTLIRSARRTLSIEISREAEILVRAPLRCPLREIARFLDSRSDWIAAHIELQQRWLAAHPEPNDAEREALIARAESELPPLVARYAELMCLSPAGLKITGAQKRFGSCSGKNRLCFSWRLLLYPDAAVEYVVVHELAHIVHKNHGPAFYSLIASILPDYRQRQELLRK